MKSIIKKVISTGTLIVSLFSFITSNAQQVRTVGEFTGIKAGDSFNIVLKQGSENSVKVDAPESVLTQIKTEVKDGVLSIYGEGNIKSKDPVTISIEVKSLTSLEVSGSADIKTENQLICDKLFIKSSGAGDVHLELKANEIKTQISGAGDVSLKGSTQTLNADVSGAGDLKASNLDADKATVKVSGAGDAKVNVKQSITADVSGAGSVIYKGNPEERNVNITGAGSVRESKSGNGEETASDTTKFKIGKRKYMIIPDGDEKGYSKHDSSHHYHHEFKHWQGIDIGVNGLLDFNNSLTMPKGSEFMELNYAKSYQFGLNLLEKDFHIYKNYVNLVVGFGFDFNHYALKNSTSLKSNSTYLQATTDSVTYKKNTLNVTYIKAPLMLEINTSKNPSKNFHLAGGIEFAYRIHSVTKQKFEADDHHNKIKQRDDFNLEPFRYSAIARVGYNNVTVFANYGLNRLFQKDKGPQVYPFTVGVTISI